MRFTLDGLPPDLKPGKYATRVKEARFVGSDLVVDLEYQGLYDEADPCLFPITKHAEAAQVGAS